MVRADDITFMDVSVQNGIEEGLKLYKPRRLRVRGGHFERLVNNGIQIHAPAADGFKGDSPDRNSEDVVVERATFHAGDDGRHGMEGQGVSVSANSPDATARRVRVLDCTFDRCVRDVWAEFNHPGMPGLDHPLRPQPGDSRRVPRHRNGRRPGRRHERKPGAGYGLDDPGHPWYGGVRGGGDRPVGLC